MQDNGPRSAQAAKANTSYPSGRTAPHAFHAETGPGGSVKLTVEQNYTGKQDVFMFSPDQWDQLVSTGQPPGSALQEGVDSVLAAVPGAAFYSADGSEAIVLLQDDHYAVAVDGDGDTRSAYLTWVRPENEDELGWTTGWEC